MEIERMLIVVKQATLQASRQREELVSEFFISLTQNDSVEFEFTPTIYASWLARIGHATHFFQTRLASAFVWKRQPFLSPFLENSLVTHRDNVAVSMDNHSPTAAWMAIDGITNRGLVDSASLPARDMQTATTVSIDRVFGHNVSKLRIADLKQILTYFEKKFASRDNRKALLTSVRALEAIVAPEQKAIVERFLGGDATKFSGSDSRATLVNVMKWMNE